MHQGVNCAHLSFAEFVYTIFSLSFHRLIVKPSRIIKDATTLIDNIFTNATDVKIVCGLLVTDVNDRMPVYAVLEMKKKLKVGTNIQSSNLVRRKSPEAILALKADLINHDSQEVYTDVIAH